MSGEEETEHGPGVLSGGSEGIRFAAKVATSFPVAGIAQCRDRAQRMEAATYLPNLFSYGMSNVPRFPLFLCR